MAGHFTRFYLDTMYFGFYMRMGTVLLALALSAVILRETGATDMASEFDAQGKSLESASIEARVARARSILSRHNVDNATFFTIGDR